MMDANVLTRDELSNVLRCGQAAAVRLGFDVQDYEVESDAQYYALQAVAKFNPARGRTLTSWVNYYVGQSFLRQLHTDKRRVSPRPETVPDEQLDRYPARTDRFTSDDIETLDAIRSAADEQWRGGEFLDVASGDQSAARYPADLYNRNLAAVRKAVFR